MNILLVTQYFHPENFKSNDVAFEMARRGHKVTVLTGLPNYPQGKVYDGYGIFRKRKEVIDGVTVYRTLVIPRGKGGGVMLALNYLSWAFIASIWAFFMSIFKKYDAVIVHETSPITQGFPALIVKWLRRTPIYFWVLDLWPESLESAGGVKNKWVLGFFTWVTKLMYRNSKKILMSSRGFRESILNKGDFEDKLVYFPNWAEDVFSDSEEVEVPALPEGFKVMFAGNLGEAQDMEAVVAAAEVLKSTSVKIILVGDGRRREWVEEQIKMRGLSDVIYTMGRHPLSAMPSFFNKADVLFLSLKDEHIFSLTVPAKLQAYMASGKPVVAMMNGEARNIIEDAGCGYSCPAGDSSGLAQILQDMSKLDKSELSEMGLRGKQYFDEHFSKDKCMEHLSEILGCQDYECQVDRR